MKLLKNIFIIFALSFLLAVGIAGTCFLGSAAIDKLNGKTEYYRKAIMLADSSQTASSVLEDKLCAILSDYKNKESEMLQFAKDTGFDYAISKKYEGPGIHNGNPNLAKDKTKDLITLTLNLGYTAHIVAHETVSNDLERTIYDLWIKLYANDTLIYVGTAVSLVITVLCLLAFYVTAAPIYKVWFYLAVITGVEYIGLNYFFHNLTNRIILMLLIEKLIIGGVLSFYICHLKRIKKAVVKINDTDDTTKPCNVRSFPASIKPLAESINDAAQSVYTATEEKVRSERLKTELISNVSHDIKTPLTSIINFSDLIFHEETENEKIKDYSKRLYDQSLHMKGLMDSLIEASKVSAGAVDINLEPCGIDTLIEQCVIEYEEKLKQNKIELVTELPGEQFSIKVDAKAMSRVIDNLLTNICKYSMPDSRAFITANTAGDKVILRFRNMSAEPINISPDELTERFVRGDLSRHSEGHGLGLSIVKSLVDLMNGEVEISARYDVFEVGLIFDKVEVSGLEVAG